MFFRVINSHKFSYPVPGRDDVLACYVRGARRKFHLTAEDGVSDADFYSR